MKIQRKPHIHMMDLYNEHYGYDVNTNAIFKISDELAKYLKAVLDSEECNYETIKNIHENLNEMIQEQKGNPEPVTIDKTEMRDLLEKSGVKEERLQDFEEHFEQAIGENTRLMAANIAETRKFEVKTPDVVVKVNPERTDLVETMEIEGKQYLVIQIDEHLEVNGISVNPETGEVQYNE